MNKILYLILICFLPVICQAQYYGVDKDFNNYWSVGITAGSAIVLGDVSASPGIQLGITGAWKAHKAYDFRIQAHVGQTSGMGTDLNTAIVNNSALNGDANQTTDYDTLGTGAYLNYRMQYIDASVQIKLNVNRLINEENNNWDAYLFGGVGTFFYQTRMDQLDASDNLYNYPSITTGTKSEIKQQLKDMRDGTYETLAEVDKFSGRVGNMWFRTFIPVGIGGRYNLTENIAVGLESRFMFMGDDLLDGQQWGLDSELDASKRDGLMDLSLILDYTF